MPEVSATTQVQSQNQSQSATTSATQQNGGYTTQASAGTGLLLNSEGHPVYYPKDAPDTVARITWNKNQNYTENYIKAFQALIGTGADGDIGTNTVNAIRHYQDKNGLEGDGKWGSECEKHSGLKREYNQVASNTSPGTGDNKQSDTEYNEETEKCTSGQKVVDYAAQFIGHTYVWGGKGQIISKDSLSWLRQEYGKKDTTFNGQDMKWRDRYDWIVANRAGERAFDCSGLCVYSYKNTGLDIGLYRPDEKPGLAKKIYSSKPKLSEMKIGDVIVSPGHYQMYNGKGKAIESCSSKGVTNTLAWDYNGVTSVYRYYDD